jgi:hypothetical protein
MTSYTEGTGAAPKRGPGLVMGGPASDLAALQHGVDGALRLTLLEAVPGHDLGAALEATFVM